MDEFEPAISSPAKRCQRCYYVIDHLGERSNCPECGMPFDLKDPFTYTTKPPFVRWKFWLPGWVTAFLFGWILYLPLIAVAGYGWASVLVAPLCIGIVLGYRVRVSSSIARVLLVLWLALGLMFALGSMNFVGAFCGLTLGAIAFGPILIGTAIGILLRKRLKQSTFSQRMHLPILFLAPLLLALIEGRHTNLPQVSLTTSTTMHVSIDDAWKSIQFYEEVKHRPPVLLWISPSLRPRYTMGSSEKVGDRKVCVYEAGRLVKEITEVIPGKRLAFRVIQQTDIENRGVRLIGGSFDLSPTPDGKGTIVTLTTEYAPHLAPRFAFLPAEELAVHTLHGHVLDGMRMDAE